MFWLESLIHSDVLGIAPTITHSHHKCSITFIHVYSWFTWVYFLDNKSEVFYAFKKFHALIENPFSKSIKILRFHSNEGGEGNTLLIISKVSYKIKASSIISPKTSPYTHQQNGVAKWISGSQTFVVRRLCRKNWMHLKRKIILFDVPLTPSQLIALHFVLSQRFYMKGTFHFCMW